MDGRARASLFLMEQLIAIVVFAVCAAVTAFIFAEAAFTAHDADDLNHALIAAKNGAEAYKAFGDTKAAAASLGGYAAGEGEAVVYYDRDWWVCGVSEAAYVLRLVAVSGDDLPLRCDLSVHSLADGDIISFSVAAKGGADG